MWNLDKDACSSPKHKLKICRKCKRSILALAMAQLCQINVSEVPRKTRRSTCRVVRFICLLAAGHSNNLKSFSNEIFAGRDV